MLPRQAIRALEEFSRTVRTPLHRKGLRLERNDTQTVKDVYQQWLLLAMDLGYLHPDCFIQEGRRLFSDMLRMDVLDLNGAFAELLRCVHIQEFKGFQALCARISPHLYRFVKGDVENVIHGDVLSAKRLIQLFSYTSRLSLREVDLTQQCLEDYLSTEASITSPAKHFLSDLNRIIKVWMKSFDPDQIRPKHGPGASAMLGRCSLETKYKNLATDELLAYAFGNANWTVGPIEPVLERISQTTFVPKSYKTFRTISMEPPTLMYFQKGVEKEIDRVVSEDLFMRTHMGIHDQTRNQRLARQGSMDRQYATIDLSAASDSVSYELVKSLFRGTKLLRYLVATRSRRTLLPDGQYIDLKKFAPMGSALCFPVETIIFAAICHRVTQEHGVTGDYSVYGDDIIVPTQCAERLIDVLGQLGFTVNRSKSFYRAETWFRESCGGEYCNGYDVTPMRVSRQYENKAIDVRLASLVDLANEAYRRKFRYLRGFFIAKLLDSDFKPLFSPTSLLGDSSTNYQAKVRWNRDLQRHEVLASEAYASRDKRAANPDESIRLRHWLEVNQERNDAPGRFIEGRRGVYNIALSFTSKVHKSTVKLRDHWFSVEDSLIDYQGLPVGQ